VQRFKLFFLLHDSLKLTLHGVNIVPSLVLPIQFLNFLMDILAYPESKIVIISLELLL